VDLAIKDQKLVVPTLVQVLFGQPSRLDSGLESCQAFLTVLPVVVRTSVRVGDNQSNPIVPIGRPRFTTSNPSMNCGC
jgi:hypothetical protein